MHTRFLLILGLVLIGISSGCQPASVPQPAHKAGFFYLTSPQSDSATIVMADAPGASPRRKIALNPPIDCSLFGLRPAPVGGWIAVEWDCSSGPEVELFDTDSGNSHFALSDQSIDSRFLTWQPDGNSLDLEIGALSVPQTVRVEADSGKTIQLPISAFVYDMAASPDDKHLLYSLSKGIGFGSETWLAGPDGQNPSQLLVDATNITALAHYSPDGTQIAYISFPDNQSATSVGELRLMDANGFTIRKLAEADAGRGFSPVWSPDSSMIAFVSRTSPDNPNSLNLSIYDLHREKLTPVRAELGSQPSWSPDGASVVFSSNPQNNSGGDTINVWLYEISSGQVNKLVTGACCAGWMH